MINVLPKGTVKSSYVLGEINSIIVAKALVINEYIIIVGKERGSWIAGISSPNRKNEKKLNRKAVMKNVVDPSSVLFEFVHGKLKLILPQRFPITEAKVSATIIINTPAIGK